MTDSDHPTELPTDHPADPPGQPMPTKVGNIPRRWRLLNGNTNWRNLLSPLDEDLRQYIIQYGEKAQATYEAFNAADWSQYTGTCRYSKQEFFDRVGLVKGNPFKYDITKYIYATASLANPSPYLYISLRKDGYMKQSNWMGYIAVSNNEGTASLGRRDILVAWRGSIQVVEWFKDADGFFEAPGGNLFQGGSGILLHRGFKSLYVDSNKRVPFARDSARDQVLSEVKRLVQVHSNEETTITVTGHSLGGALGTLNAIDIVSSNSHRVGVRTLPVTAFLFAVPTPGNGNLKQFADKIGVKILRVTNVRDIVPMVPPKIAGFEPIGEELKVDSLKSDYLKNPGDVGVAHDLEVYLHLVAHTQGNAKEVRGGRPRRDIDLVNKFSDGLKSQYYVPPYWNVIANKNMVQQPDGSWKLNDKPHYQMLDDVSAVGDDDDDEDEGEASEAA